MAYMGSHSSKGHYDYAGANAQDGGVTVIDGATNTTSTLAIRTTPINVTVNPVTNKIYVANERYLDKGSVTVIDGLTEMTATVSTGVERVPSGKSLAVNPETNKIYVTYSGYYNDDGHFYTGMVTVIDGSSNRTAATTFAPGIQPVGIAINTVTNKIFVTNLHSNDVTVMDGRAAP